MRFSAAVPLALCLVGCATARPPTAGREGRPLLQLSPASLGQVLSLAQRVTVEREAERWSFEALLEADEVEVRLAAFVLGQTIARLRWDGRTLDAESSPRAPAVVTPERILSDVQLAFWPAEAVRGGLAADFALEERPDERLVTLAGRPYVRVRYATTPPPWRHVELTHEAFGYRLTIESKELP